MSSLDWFALTLQVLTLLLMVALTWIKQKKRNLFAIFIPTTLLVLVQGQIAWLFAQFELSGNQTITHLTQEISRVGAQLANLYALGLTLTLYITYLTTQAKTTNKDALIVSKITLAHYSLFICWVLLSALLIIQINGGLISLLSQPGQSIGGQTLLLISLSMGKLPFIYKLSNRQKPSIFDAILLGTTLLFTLLNSRFLTSLYLFQLLLIYNYSFREISRKTLNYVAVSLVFIFIVYGLYRDVASIDSETPIADRPNAVIARLSSEESPIDWFYRANVEGFAGLAGIVTANEQSPIKHDLGLSNLALITQFIPNQLRNNTALPFNRLTNFLSGLYPYTGSVVPSGLENAFAHFGVVGLFLLGALLGFLMRFLNTTLQTPSANRLLYALLSVQVFNLIRGTFRNALFFGLADLFIYGLFMLIISTRLVFSEQSLQIKIKRYAPRH